MAKAFFNISRSSCKVFIFCCNFFKSSGEEEVEIELEFLAKYFFFQVARVDVGIPRSEAISETFLLLFKHK